jgi:very-short-patch-repair endonuclease
VNTWITVDGEEMQFDFVWHAQRLVVEVDGWATHRTGRSFREDRRRDRLLRLGGWEVVRYTWDDVVHDAARVEREVRSLIAEARTLGGLSGLRSS